MPPDTRVLVPNDNCLQCRRAGTNSIVGLESFYIENVAQLQSNSFNMITTHTINDENYMFHTRDSNEYRIIKNNKNNYVVEHAHI